MSFMKKIFRRSFSAKQPEFPLESGQFVIPRDSLLYRNDSVSNISRDVLFSNETEDDISESISPRSWHSTPITSSADEDDGGSDVNEIYRRKIRVLNTSLDDFRKRQKKLSKKQKEIAAMDTEIEELLRMIKLFKLQSNALDLEKDHKMLEMATLCNNISSGGESEIRKKEPILFRKYNNIKTSKDAKSLTVLIRQKKAALQNLEILAYKKYLTLSYGLKQNESTNKGSKITHDDFEKAFESVRNSMDDEALKQLFTDSQNEANEEIENDNSPMSRVSRAVIRGRYERLFGSTPV